MMQTIPSINRRCFICGSADRYNVEAFSHTAVFIQDNYYFLPLAKGCCKNCGLIYAYEYPQMDAIQKLYVSLNEGPANLTYRFSAAPDHNQFFIDHLEKLFPRKARKVLDVGCGRCQTLNRLKSSGWETCGVDISPLSQEIGQAQGHTVLCGSFEEVDFKSQKFDCLIFEESFEHMLDPNRTLKRARLLLTDAGCLAISLPDAQSCLESRNVYDILREDHCNHFTPDSMRRFLEAEGFFIKEFTIDRRAPVPDMKLIAAKHDQHEADLGSVLPARVSSEALAERYRKMKEEVRAVFQRETAPYKRIGLYCAGTYATIILPAFLGYDLSRCHRIFDNDPRKIQKELFGKIISPGACIQEADLDALFIASEQFENEIYGNLKGDFSLKMPLIRIHELVKKVLGASGKTIPNAYV